MIADPARPETLGVEGGVATPGCPLYGGCGGCQLQHLSPEAQLAWKTAEVRRLYAAGGIAADIAACVSSPAVYGYRSKITPHFPRPRDGRVPPIGFLRAGGRRETIDVAACALATPAINARLATLRAEVAAKAGAGAYRRGATLLLRDAASGVTTDPRTVVTERVGELTLRFPAGDFFQNNPFLLPRLAAHVADQARRTGARFLVDAYSGSGLLALVAAPAFERVVGVEVSKASVEWARDNAARNARDNCTFIAADAGAVFDGVPFAGAEAVVIVDPPRKGCSPEFLAELTAFGPRAVVYVSCNPETQVRDATVLREAGYRVDHVQPFDMFPQTRHLESVATLLR
jgi:23S rRNA (uracil1939-C5)-methyltransferase/tRNA (uracil-5-)-methyltransferase